MLQAVKNSTCDFLNFYKYPEDMPVAGKYDIPVVKGIRVKHKILKSQVLIKMI